MMGRLRGHRVRGRGNQGNTRGALGTRGKAMCMAVGFVLTGYVRFAGGAPAPVFDNPIPSAADEPPEVRDLKSGDYSVATKTGSFNYSYPITVPPGRLGMEPSLALTYSSQGSTYGEIAAGWELPIPYIEIDPGTSQLEVNYELERVPKYRSSMSGGHLLVQVTEPVAAAADVLIDPNGNPMTYRARYDDQYLRYEKVAAPGPIWRVLSPDGVIHYFGDVDHIEDEARLNTWTPLTRTVDKFGNTVHYYWTRDEGSTTVFSARPRIDRIVYTDNENVLQSYSNFEGLAEVKFNWRPTTCPGTNDRIGLATNYRRGQHSDLAGVAQEHGDYELMSIQIGVKETIDATSFTPRRLIDFDYDDPCEPTAGPVRYLKSIQESAWDPSGQNVTTMPAVTFRYGNTDKNYEQTNWYPAPPGALGLSWGTRDPVQALDGMLIDLDGDGRQDYLRTDPNGGRQTCRFEWFKNTGSGWSSAPTDLYFPRLPWSNGQGESSDSREACSLQGQTTFFSNRDIGSLTCGEIGTILNYRFTDMNGDGLPDLLVSVNADYAHFHWNPDAADMVPNPITGFEAVQEELGPQNFTPDGFCVDPTQAQIDGMMDCTGSACYLDPDAAAAYVDQAFEATTRSTVPCDTHLGGPPPVDVNQPPSCPVDQAPHEHNGKYIWLRYLNLGNGSFEELDSACSPSSPDAGCNLSCSETPGAGQCQMIRSPVPLEPTGAQSSMGSPTRGFSSGLHALMDVDGDQIPDVISACQVGNCGSSWKVYRGTGESFQEEPRVWPAPDGTTVAVNVSLTPHSCNGDDCRTAFGKDTLADINGDGLVDLLAQDGPDEIRAYLNYGLGFLSDGPVVTDHENGGAGASLPVTSYTWQDNIAGLAGDGFGWLRLIDYDQDGRIDLYNGWDWDFDHGAELATHEVHTSLGDGTLRRGQGLAGSTKLSSQMYVKDNSLGDWAVTHDLVDIDGDGNTEMVLGMIPCPGGGGVCFDVREHYYGIENPDPFRLMRGINNGRGLDMDIEYTHANDPLWQTEGADETSGIPTHTKVVTRVSVAEDLGAGWTSSPQSSTTYRYGNAVWNADDRGRYGFRGFDTVETHAPSGAVTVEQFDYDTPWEDTGAGATEADWSGRLVKQATYLSAGDMAALMPTTVRLLDYYALRVLSGESTSFVVKNDTVHKCTVVQDEGACTASNSNKYRQRWEYMRLRATSTDPTVAWFRWYHIEHEATLEGDRLTLLSPRIRFTDTEYRTCIVQERGNRYTDGSWTVETHKVFLWDITCKTHSQDKVKVDLVAGSPIWAQTKYTYDLATGLLESRTKPEQMASAGPSETYTHDEFLTHVETTTNELGHVVETTYDTATGVLLEQRGPNGPVGGAREGFRAEIDGFGRPLERFVAVDDGAGSYIDESQTTWTYDDQSVPSSVTTTSRIEHGPTPQYTVSTTSVDGYGRTIHTVTEAGTSDPFSTFEYDESGNLVRLITTSPYNGPSILSGNVEYRFAYDSLGRTLGYRQPYVNGLAPEPPASFPADCSQLNTWTGVGLDVCYDGLATTRRERVEDGGPAAETVTVNDAFGNLIEVQEQIAPSVYATTTYDHNFRGQVIQIIDPEGLQTDLVYDFGGRRRSITRGNRVWSYSYDLNDNLATSVAPGVDPMDPNPHTVSIAYDDLDRVTSRWAGARALTATQQDEYAAGPAHLTQYGYDAGENGLGRLTSVDGPVIDASFTYDALGRSTSELREFTLPSSVLAQPFTFNATSYTSYNANGSVREHVYADGSLPNVTRVRYHYDVRGLPVSVEWDPFSILPQEVVASLTRSTAGGVISRAGGSGGCLTQSWNRDHLGRTTLNQVSNQCHPNADGFSDEMTYYDSGDVDQLTVLRGSMTNPADTPRTFYHSYDDRHQLTYLDDSLMSGYVGDFDYGPAGRLTTAKVSSGGLGNVRSRWVEYDYSATVGSDPEAVDRLMDLNTGNPLLVYGYDESGNVMAREDPSQQTAPWEFFYDGEDNQREVVNPDGSSELYYYDENGQRALSVHRAVGGSVDRIRFWHGGTEIWLDNLGNETKTWAHVGIEGQTVARVERLAGGSPTLEQQFHNDLGHLMGAVSSDYKKLEAGFIYSPFGEIIDDHGTTEDFLRRFNGKEWDETSGLSYYGYRYYDPVAMVWTQADPLYRFAPDLAYDEPRRMNLYAFSGQNPLRYLDPDGRDWFGKAWDRAAELSTAIAFPSAASSALGPNPIAQAIKAAKPTAEDVAIEAIAASSDGISPIGDVVGLGIIGARKLDDAGRAIASALSGEDSVRVFRAVSKGEANDIARTGTFRQKPDGKSMEGKWFSETKEGAQKFVDDPRFDSTEVVEADVPKDVYDRSHKDPNIDDTGAGVVVEKEDLPKVRPVEKAPQRKE